MSNLRWGLIAAICAFFLSAALGFFFAVGLSHIIIRAFVFAIVFFGVGFSLRFLIGTFFPEILFPAESEPAQEEVEQPASRINITVDNTGEYAVPELYKASDSGGMGNIEDLISGSFRPLKIENDLYLDPKQPADQWFQDSMAEESVDRNKEDGYNDYGGMEGASFFEGDAFQSMPVFESIPSAPGESVEKPAAKKPQFTPSLGDESDSGLGGLPDLDMMARAFSSGEQPAINEWPVKPAGTQPAESSFSAPSLELDGPPMSFAPDVEEKTRNAGNKPQLLEGDFDPQRMAQGISTILRKD